jgi:hypothetical protein
VTPVAKNRSEWQTQLEPHRVIDRESQIAASRYLPSSALVPNRLVADDHMTSCLRPKDSSC